MSAARWVAVGGCGVFAWAGAESWISQVLCNVDVGGAAFKILSVQFSLVPTSHVVLLCLALCLADMETSATETSF